MATKRARATYEADLRTQQSPFVIYGTPLPPLDPEIRDDGSFVPVWKQEVLDERGRKRLHGAFTGGFSAGYFNTVGSKEGWSPATFVSSRSARQKDAPKSTPQRVEDFMDEEDLADKEETERLQTKGDYTELGTTEGDMVRSDVLMGLLRTGVQDEGMGRKLLRKMGWKDGQGVGPKVRRKARTREDSGGGEADLQGESEHMFAPENTAMIAFIRKTDQKGLGYEAHTRLVATNTVTTTRYLEPDDPDGGLEHFMGPKKKKNVKLGSRGSMGVGILNDTGSDDEDPYEIGPRMAYNRVIGGDKKMKKRKESQHSSPTANPLLAAKPVFISKKAVTKTGKLGFRKCHDGRLLLEGFVFSTDTESISLIVNQDGIYPPPEVPEGWKSAKQPSFSVQDTANYQSTADAAKATKLDPQARASLLGEAQLPGKSVFDFLTPAARQRLVLASGKGDLPEARGESAPKGYDLTAEEKQRELWNAVPRLERTVALKALGRGVGGWMPYAEDEAKRSRYRGFLEIRADVRDGLPEQASGMSKEDWIKELREFAHAAEIFKPMTGLMASRFTSSATPPKLASDASESTTGSASLISQPLKKAEDPAEAAARLGMFGPLTRSTHQFLPTRLLCKRFNVKPPTHIQVDADKPPANGQLSGEGRYQTGTHQTPSSVPGSRTTELVSKSAIDTMLLDPAVRSAIPLQEGKPKVSAELQDQKGDATVDAERNAALEADRPGDAVFKAIFGSDDEDDDDDDGL